MSFFSMLHVPPHTLERVDLGGSNTKVVGLIPKKHAY